MLVFYFGIQKPSSKALRRWVVSIQIGFKTSHELFLPVSCGSTLVNRLRQSNSSTFYLKKYFKKKLSRCPKKGCHWRNRLSTTISHSVIKACQGTPWLRLSAKTSRESSAASRLLDHFLDFWPSKKPPKIGNPIWNGWFITINWVWWSKSSKLGTLKIECQAQNPRPKSGHSQDEEGFVHVKFDAEGAAKDTNDSRRAVLRLEISRAPLVPPKLWSNHLEESVLGGWCWKMCGKRKSLPHRAISWLTSHKNSWEWLSMVKSWLMILQVINHDNNYGQCRVSYHWP